MNLKPLKISGFYLTKHRFRITLKKTNTKGVNMKNINKSNYCRKIFSLVHLQKIFKTRYRHKKIISAEVLAPIMHILVESFVDDLQKNQQKYLVSSTKVLVDDKYNRRGVWYVKNMEIVYFANLNDLLYQSSKDKLNNFFVMSEFGLSGEKVLVDNLFKKFLIFIKLQNFNMLRKRAIDFLKERNVLSLLDDKYKLFYV